MAILVREQVLWDDPVLELRRQPPLARHHVVAGQVPPEVIVQLLGSTVDLPAAEDLERLTVHDEDAWRPVCAVLAAATKRTDVDAFRPAVDRVGPRVAGFFEQLLRLDDLVDRRLSRIWLRIHHIDARGADAWDDQITPLEKRVTGERRQGRRAGIPAEMVELVPLVGHRHRVDDLTVGRRARLHVDHRERVRFREVRAKQQSVGEVLRRSLHRKLGRCVEGWIGPHRHRKASLLLSRRSAAPVGWARVPLGLRVLALHRWPMFLADEDRQGDWSWDFGASAAGANSMSRTGSCAASNATCAETAA